MKDTAAAKRYRRSIARRLVSHGEHGDSERRWLPAGCRSQERHHRNVGRTSPLLELEKAILAHPAVLEAGVIPVPDENGAKCPKPWWSKANPAPRRLNSSSSAAHAWHTTSALAPSNSYQFAQNRNREILKKDLRKKYCTARIRFARTLLREERHLSQSLRQYLLGLERESAERSPERILRRSVFHGLKLGRRGVGIPAMSSAAWLAANATKD